MINTNVKKQYPVIRMPNGHPVSSTMYNRGDLHGVIYNNDVEFDDVLLSNITATSTVFANLNVSTIISFNTSSLSSSLANVTVSKLINSTITTTSNITTDINLAYNLSASLLATGTTTADLTVTGGSTFDADAQAFFDRVTTAGGTLTITEQNAVNTLVVQMKADGIWTKMKAIYPMVGASSAACAQNLKSSSFTGTFTSGWTFASTGVTPNGTSAYMNTNYNPSVSGLLNSAHLSVYQRTNLGISGILVLMGAKIGSNIQTIVPSVYGGNSYNSLNGTDSFLNFVYSRTDGFILTNRTNSSDFNSWRNSTKLNTTTQSTVGFPNGNIFISGRNNGSGVSLPDSNEKSFASIGDGLTDAEAANFYTAVQAFQTSLNRQVN